MLWCLVGGGNRRWGGGSCRFAREMVCPIGANSLRRFTEKFSDIDLS